MFNFFRMMDNYEDRKVGRYDDANDEKFYISTAEVNDSTQPFETAVAHPRYYDGKLIIVEQYDTRQEAAEGHQRWVATMTAPELPPTLKDVSTAGIAQLCSLFGDEWRERPLEIAAE